MFRLKNEQSNFSIVGESDIFSNLQFLMIQRKDSISYVEFIRGKYSIEKSSYIYRLFSDMTEGERIRIRDNDFKTLWDKLWMNHDSNIFKNEFDSAKDKFNMLKKGYRNSEGIFISMEICMRDTFTMYSTPEWEFPKGRRNIREDDRNCAIREFNEETGIPPEDYTIIDEIPPFQELFTGSNNVKYRIVYYIAYYKSNNVPMIDPTNLAQISEVSNIDWMKFDEVVKIIKPHFLEKKKVITSIFYLMMLIMDSIPKIDGIHGDDEDFNIQLSSIVSKYYRSPRQFYSKSHKNTRFKKMGSSDSD